MKVLTLKPGREKSARNRHPWIFSGAVARVDDGVESGETVRVVSHKDEVLGIAAYSPASSIRARFWSFGDEEVNEDFFYQRIHQALRLRQRMNLDRSGNAMRLVHGESDGLPGLIVDQYADIAVVQILAAGADRWRDKIFNVLTKFEGIQTVVERSDADVRLLEGLETRTQVISGHLVNPLEIVEHGIRYRVDVMNGQKTGFYLDQCQNRKLVMETANGKKVLNCFSYTGGFGLAALKGGAARLTSIDSSGEALDLAKQNMAINEFNPEAAEWIEGDAFVQLRKLRDMNRKYDLIVMDPPKFAPTAAQANKAARGYKDINLLGLKLLSPGGFLFTFSCSGGISAEFFRTILYEAALDAKINAQIVGQMHQEADHPIALNFPEGEYLKGLILHVK